MKFILIFILIVKNGIVLTFEGCHTDVFDEVNSEWYSYCGLYNYDHKKGAPQSWTFCFIPKRDIRYLSIYIFLADIPSDPVAELQNYVTNSMNKLKFTVQKIPSENNYAFEIKFRNENVYSSQLPLWKLQAQDQVLEYDGSLAASVGFFATNATHSTNCNDELQPLTFWGCNQEPQTENKTPYTSCYFNKFYPLKNGESRRLRMCFQPEPTFQYASSSILSSNLSLHKHFGRVGLVEFEIDAINEVLLKITKIDSETFDVQFQDSSTELSVKDVQQERILKLALSGLWKGSRYFTSEDDGDFTNCIPEWKDPFPTKPQIEVFLKTENPSFGLPFILTIAVVLILLTGVTCSVATFMYYRKNKQATVGSTATEVPNLEVKEAAKSGQGKKDDDVPCYVNLGVVENVQEELQTDKSGELTYAVVEFEAGRKNNEISRNPRKKEPKVIKTAEIKHSKKENAAENEYSTIGLEVQSKTEEIQYINIGEHAMNNNPREEAEEVAIYQNIGII